MLGNFEEIQIHNHHEYHLATLKFQAVAVPLPRETRIPVLKVNTVKPVCNDHLYNKIYYLWVIQ